MNNSIDGRFSVEGKRLSRPLHDILQEVEKDTSSLEDMILKCATDFSIPYEDKSFLLLKELEGLVDDDGYLGAVSIQQMFGIDYGKEFKDQKQSILNLGIPKFLDDLSEMYDEYIGEKVGESKNILGQKSHVSIDFSIATHADKVKEVLAAS